MNNPKNIDLEALKNIDIWECAIKDHDGETMILQRQREENTDRIVIDQSHEDEHAKPGIISISTDAAYILATALLMMQSE